MFTRRRLRQLVGEMLIYIVATVLLTGGYLALDFVPRNDMIAYDGGYAPLRGVMMSEAYESTLTISFDVRGGLLARQLHHRFPYVFGLGVVVWILLGRLRHGFAVLGLTLLAALGGYGSVDDLLAGTVLGGIPVLFWYGLHLLAALAVVVLLVISARQEAVTQPRPRGFTLAGLALTALIFLL